MTDHRKLIDETRALLAAASYGAQWSLHDDGPGDREVVGPEAESVASARRSEDAAFIASAPYALRLLMHALEAQTAEVVRLRAEVAAGTTRAPAVAPGAERAAWIEHVMAMAVQHAACVAGASRTIGFDSRASRLGRQTRDQLRAAVTAAIEGRDPRAAR